MKPNLIVFLVMAISLAGCTSMRPMDPVQTDFATELETGDHLVVTEKDGRIVDMTFAQVEDGWLVGSLTKRPLDTVQVEIDQILKIEIEKISGGKTTAAVIGGIVLLPLAAVGVGLAAFAGG